MQETLTTPSIQHMPSNNEGAFHQAPQMLLAKNPGVLEFCPSLAYLAGTAVNKLNQNDKNK